MSKRTGIMLATMFTEKLFNKMPKPVYVQPKLEGDRLRTPIQDNNIHILSSGGKERISVPHIYREIQATGWNNIELDGELYKQGMKHSEIRSIVSRTKNLHPNYDQMEYHIYDIISSERQFNRLDQLTQLLWNAPFSHIKLVPSLLVDNLDSLQKIYKNFLQQGYEGIIIRHPSAPYTRRKVTTLLKLKPRVSELFEIVDVIEEQDKHKNHKGTFGAFVCKTSEGTLFSVGSGPTNYQRAILWQNQNAFIGRFVKIRFQDYTKIRQVPKLLSIDKQWLLDMQFNWKI